MFMKEVMVEILLTRLDLEVQYGQVQILMVFKIQLPLMEYLDQILQNLQGIQLRLEKEILLVM